MIATCRWYLTADRQRAVPEGDPDAAYLLVAKGSEISDRLAAEWGIVEAKAVEAPPANKALEYPVETKRQPRLVKKHPHSQND